MSIADRRPWTMGDIRRLRALADDGEERTVPEIAAILGRGVRATYTAAARHKIALGRYGTRLAPAPGPHAVDVGG